MNLNQNRNDFAGKVRCSLGGALYRESLIYYYFKAINDSERTKPSRHANCISIYRINSSNFHSSINIHGRKIMRSTLLLTGIEYEKKNMRQIQWFFSVFFLREYKAYTRFDLIGLPEHFQNFDISTSMSLLWNILFLYSTYTYNICENMYLCSALLWFSRLKPNKKLFT